MFLAPKKKYNLTPFTDKRLNKVIAKGDLKSKGWKKGDVEMNIGQIHESAF